VANQPEENAMIRAVRLLTLATGFVLPGCSQEPADPPAQPGQAVSASPVAKAPVAEPTPPTAEPVAVTAMPESTPFPSATVAATAIPTAIRGRWGLVPADCTSKLGDAKGLLTISAAQLKFYESVAKLGAIKEAGGTRIRATFRYSGEGQSWTQEVVLDAQDGGKTLIRRDYGPDALPGPFRYVRCR
jgi:hypothetical protein